MSEVGNVSIWVGKYRANFETNPTWIVAIQLQCFFLTWSKIFQFKQSLFNFSCAFQLWLELSNITLYNFISNFPTFRSYQLQFPTSYPVRSMENLGKSLNGSFLSGMKLFLKRIVLFAWNIFPTSMSTFALPFFIINA